MITAEQMYFGRLLVKNAIRYGIPPEKVLAHWGQESGYSADLGLKGDELSRGRGHAIGPMQIVPFYHPKADLSTPEGQADYAVRYLAQVGTGGYYGRGRPPAGHPTTRHYEQQIRDREQRLREGKEPLMSGVWEGVSPGGLTIDITNPAGVLEAGGSISPYSGAYRDYLERRRAAQQRSLATMFDHFVPDPNDEPSQALGMPLKAEQPIDPFTRLMANPWTQIGLGILSANANGTNDFMATVAQGTMAGMRSYQAQQALEAEMEETRLRRAEARMARQRQIENRNQMLRMAERYADQGMLNPEMLQAALTGNLPAWISGLQLQREMAQEQALANAAGGAGADYGTGAAGTPGGATEPNLPPAPTTAPAPSPDVPPAPAPAAPSPDVTPAPAPAAASPGAPPTASIPLVTRNPEIERGFQEQEARIARLPPAQAWEARKALEEQKFNYQKEQIKLDEENRRRAEDQARQDALRAAESARSDEQRITSQENTLRTAYGNDPAIAKYRRMEPQVANIKTLFKQGMEGSTTAQLGMIFGFSKAMDEASVVREGEVDVIQYTDGPFGLLKNAVEYIRAGNKLTPEKMAELYESTRSYLSTSKQLAADAQDRFVKNVISEYPGLNANRITGGSIREQPDVLPPAADLQKEWTSRPGGAPLALDRERIEQAYAAKGITVVGWNPDGTPQFEEE